MSEFIVAELRPRQEAQKSRTKFLSCHGRDLKTEPLDWQSSTLTTALPRTQTHLTRRNINLAFSFFTDLSVHGIRVFYAAPDPISCRFSQPGLFRRQDRLSVFRRTFSVVGHRLWITMFPLIF